MPFENFGLLDLLPGFEPLLVSPGELTAVYARPKPNTFDATFGFSFFPNQSLDITLSYDDWWRCSWNSTANQLISIHYRLDNSEATVSSRWAPQYMSSRSWTVYDYYMLVSTPLRSFQLKPRLLTPLMLTDWNRCVFQLDLAKVSLWRSVNLE